MAGLPSHILTVYFAGCTSLTSVVELPESVTYADFQGCIRLRRIRDSNERFYFEPMFNPAQDVHTLMVSGLSNKLLSAGIGPDAALLIARFVTPGMSASTDRMETMQQVRARYGIRGGCAPRTPHTLPKGFMKKKKKNCK